ncbi:MAG: zinc metallopeptidase [Anaerococcus sp.]|uniref:KPN_02809 family neutral zinc metallopeptidase n=1 Tax=Anaerococcus sp. TaxID=1872515 RepID=UPI00260C3836|nr:neutral zinc metallopeptidase [Anaerococcus sp.]MCI5971730.1 zinc metallopeptidase [Anaerococcus sp.]MDD6918544.1 zinc metallopeptidase [Peptoniphilaceae bacterium]MDY2927197.1 neutral zinc metallopeptidase [Anaerococcus sp.]
MKWEDRRRSSNVNRGSKAPIAVGGGIGGIVIMLLLYFLGVDPSVVTNDNQQVNQNTQIESSEVSKERETLEDFLSVILADTEDVWHEKFEEKGGIYHEAQMTLYQDTTKTGCGIAQSRMGPFYCPVDKTVYFDVSFYDDLKSRFGGGGDFALAYVLAHEVGHHVQNELGIIKQTNDLRQRLSEKEYNKVSVAQELQADYFAGLFAYYVKEKGYLEEGDIEEAINAASAIGDDRIQEMAGRDVDVDSFTHGSSAQRKEAFDLGFKYHDIDHSMKFFEDLNI